jgi:hypothetical protein
MLDENEGANERDGRSCAMTMFAYLASAVPTQSFILFRGGLVQRATKWHIVWPLGLAG